MAGTAVPELEPTHPELEVNEVVKAARRPTPADRAQRDDEMMYAWSIGTTRAAAEYSAPKRNEECPPEVYIG